MKESREKNGELGELERERERERESEGRINNPGR